MSNWHPLFASLPLESVIKDHQQEYYQALELSDQQADSTPFIHFMLTVIAQTLAQNVTQNAPVNPGIDVSELKTADAIIMLLTENKELTRQQLAQIISKDIRTIGRALAKLQQTGRIKRVGSDKNGYWKVEGN